jgi:DNA gyrase/topoisomerase IV subunit A
MSNKKELLAEDHAKKLEETLELIEKLEKNLSKRERSLQYYDEYNSIREKELSQRETEVIQREKELSQREVEVIQREKEWDLSKVGTKVRRYFDKTRKWIDGMVVKWYPYDASTGDEALWHVIHTDLDEEDLNEMELMKAIEDYKTFHETCSLYEIV